MTLPAEAKGSRLELLLGDIAGALEHGQYAVALRAADCACRLAPQQLTCLLVYARLLTRCGAAAEAVERLGARQEPEAAVARAEALCAQGLVNDAAAACQVLLWRRAADSLENLPELAARLCYAPGQDEFPGWVGVDTGLRLVGQVKTPTQLRIAYGDIVMSPGISAVGQDGLASFFLQVPPEVSGRLAVHAGDRKLLGSDVPWPPDFGLYGWVQPESGKLVGEARLDWAPELPLRLLLECRNRKYIQLPIPASSGGSMGTPFSIPLDQQQWSASRVQVSALLPDGTHSALSGSPVELRTPSPARVGARLARTELGGSGRKPCFEQTVDIVVPVYAGCEETLACLRSALATTTRSQAELVVVNDASPDPNLCEVLERLAREGSITLLTNSSNLGFPGAANRGMSLHAERDIVLLNADTELFGDWLRRLKLAAYSADDIGTVTPLSEGASITSYPGQGGRALTAAEAEAIDLMARELNARKVVELPVGVGYCLYLKRACLLDTGIFDERSFGKGYGEETDFCLRARGLGWRHVAATDLFVRHRVGRSFGHLRQVLLKRNRHVLNALHPGYDAMIADFVASDPLLEARRAIDMHRLLSEAVAPVLLVTADLPGGVKRHVEVRQSELESAGKTVVVLQPAAKRDGRDQVVLRAKGLENLLFDPAEELPLLRGLLLGMKLTLMEVHHFTGLPAVTLEMVVALGIPYDVYIHDYAWVCPRVTLVDAEDNYCGQPPLEDCEACQRRDETPSEESLTVEALRARSARILHAAATVIAPSNDARTRLARYFPTLAIQVRPWETRIEPVTRPRTAAVGRVRVAVIGAIGIAKGYRILLGCARDAAERHLDLDFAVVGHTYDDAQLWATGRVFITGPYAESEIGVLLERQRCHAAFFPSLAPETWCYALTHAVRAGLPIVAFEMGAIAERLRTQGTAELLSPSTTPAAINDALLRAARRADASNPQKEMTMDSTPTSNPEADSTQLAASVQVLTLPVGTYVFTVQGGAATTTPSERLTLPALQVGVAPVKSPGMVEFLSNAGTLDRWLARRSDMIIAKISGGSVALLLTSLRSPDSSTLAIDVRRLEAQPRPLVPGVQVGQAVDGSALEVLPVRVMAHIQGVGDVHFDEGWVGCLGERLWIEAFAINSVGELASDGIEYRGITGDGFETPWLSNQTLCGSRGRAMPLIAFAIRLKSNLAERYECTYAGRFLSGSTIGPCKEGEPCRSDIPGDPLWGVQLRVERHKTLETGAAGENSRAA